ncbi:putative universal stress protein family protein [Lyophyllum shimeji]|uniref:Universal stress protein family protein n=1 Tax=Lyophyllum shimeji TaxID=47721 RepID=A0A9P3PQD0_LYOSH|nr:putative universal stress protein family protein [Lyophyllum shimeji]
MALRSAMKHSSRPSTPQVSPLPSSIPLPAGSSDGHVPALSLSPSSASLSACSSNATSIAPAPSSNNHSSPSHGVPPQSILLSPHQHHPHHHANANPPATPGYTSKVSFDTFENTSASMFSFTLQVKSEGYRRTRSTRVFLCAASLDESGREALDWALESLVQDGDELIVFRGVDEDVLEKDHNVVREEARELMRQIQAKSVEYDPDRKLSLILEYIPGRVTDTLDRLIALYRPDSVVVGTRGKRSVLSGLTLNMNMGSTIGSVSKYCLTHSPVPIIVVRPERKVRKAVEKRRADPRRGTHFET